VTPGSAAALLESIHIFESVTFIQELGCKVGVPVRCKKGFGVKKATA
jgi:hypothetical protein